MNILDIQGLFNQMWVFADSLSDYGSTTVYVVYKLVVLILIMMSLVSLIRFLV